MQRQIGQIIEFIPFVDWQKWFLENLAIQKRSPTKRFSTFPVDHAFSEIKLKKSFRICFILIRK